MTEQSKKAAVAEFESAEHGGEYSRLLGQPVSVLTTTMFYTGILVRVEPTAFVLTQADWVGETGPWHEYAESLTAGESSPFPPECEVYVSRAQFIIIFAADPKKVQASKLTRRLTPKQEGAALRAQKRGKGRSRPVPTFVVR